MRYATDMERLAPHPLAAGQSPAPVAPATLPREAIDEKVRLAPRYRVLIHNDDVTPMDFVVDVLAAIFRKPFEDAVRIMSEAHHAGVALVDVLPLEEAEFRMEQARSKARTAKFPLAFTCEPE